MTYMDMNGSAASLTGVRTSTIFWMIMSHVRGSRSNINARCFVTNMILKRGALQMPQNEWIKGALLIPENNTYKVDGSGRIVIPSYLRSKFRIEAGD